LKDSTMFWFWTLLAFLIPGAIMVAYIMLDTRHMFPRFLKGAVNPITLMSIGSGCGYLAKRYYARMMGPSAAEYLMAEDPRKPVVYLRSFRADIKEGKPRNLQAETQEEMLKSAFSQAGPFVALGRPHEKFPTLGAARMYVGDDWEQAVADIMSRARLVVVRTGDTAGLHREVVHATQELKPEQLLLIVPRGRKAYEAFCSKVQPSFPRPLPKYPVRKTPRAGIKGLICFESDWTPRFLTFKHMPVRGSILNPLPRALQAMLCPVYERLGIPWHPPSVNWMRLLILGVLAIAILYVLYQIAK
jgi:hypothetical protein